MAQELGAQVIRGLLKVADKIWTYRSQQLHGEEVHRDPKEKHKALSQLQSLYNRQHEVSQQDKLLLTKPLQEWKQTASKTIVNWCMQVKKSLRKQKIVDAKVILAAHHPIYEYFPQLDPLDKGTNDGLSLKSEESTNEIESRVHDHRWNCSMCTCLHFHFHFHLLRILFNLLG